MLALSRPAVMKLVISVNHLPVNEVVVGRLEMGKFQRAHRLDDGRQGLIGTAPTARLPQAAPCRTQGAQDLRPIEALALTVVAEAHDRLLASLKEKKFGHHRDAPMAFPGILKRLSSMASAIDWYPASLGCR